MVTRSDLSGAGNLERSASLMLTAYGAQMAGFCRVGHDSVNDSGAVGRGSRSQVCDRLMMGLEPDGGTIPGRASRVSKEGPTPQPPPHCDGEGETDGYSLPLSI